MNFRLPQIGFASLLAGSLLLGTHASAQEKAYQDYDNPQDSSLTEVKPTTEEPTEWQLYREYYEKAQAAMKRHDLDAADAHLAAAAFWMLTLEEAIAAERRSYSLVTLRHMQTELSSLYHELTHLHHLDGDHGEAFLSADDGLEIWANHNTLQNQRERAADAIIAGVMPWVKMP